MAADGRPPVNKQFEPILFSDALLNMEPRGWMTKREGKIRGTTPRAHKRTGRTLCRDDAMTHYNTPVFGRLPTARPPLQGRGAYHGAGAHRPDL